MILRMPPGVSVSMMGSVVTLIFPNQDAAENFCDWLAWLDQQEDTIDFTATPGTGKKNAHKNETVSEGNMDNETRLLTIGWCVSVTDALSSIKMYLTKRGVLAGVHLNEDIDLVEHNWEALRKHLQGEGNGNAMDGPTRKHSGR